MGEKCGKRKAKNQESGYIHVHTCIYNMACAGTYCSVYISKVGVYT